MEKQRTEGTVVCFLDDLLHSSHLSLNALADRLGKSRSGLFRWQKNHAKEFEFDTLARLCAIFVFQDQAAAEQNVVRSIPLALVIDYQGVSPGEDGHTALAPGSSTFPSRLIPVVAALPALPEQYGKIACHLKTLMEGEQLTFKELGEQTGLRKETLSKIARGKTRSISRQALVALCQRYGGIDQLFSYVA
jgi:DNA-binding Xre family transcriptional regulator